MPGFLSNAGACCSYCVDLAAWPRLGNRLRQPHSAGLKSRGRGSWGSAVVVAGRRNNYGSSRQQQKSRDRSSKAALLSKKVRTATALEGAQRQNQEFFDISQLKEDHAVGQVISAQANFMRVLVTKCSEAAEIPTLEEMDSASPANGLLEESCTGSSGPAKSKIGTELLCVVRAVLKKLRRRVYVGDAVVIGGIDWIEARGMIADILPRSSTIVDPPIANVDHVLLLFALDRPQLDPKPLSRFLVATEATGVPFSLVLNKADLVSEKVHNWTAAWNMGWVTLTPLSSHS